MRKILFLALISLPISAQTLLRSYIVSALPSASTVSGVTLFVDNGSTATDCTVGGGVFLVPCKSNGSAWVVQSIGNTSGVTPNIPVLASNSTGSVVAASTTGTGSTVVLANGPTLTAPALGTPASGNAANLVGLPLNGGVTGILQAANMPAFSGDWHNSAGSLTTTVTGINGASVPANSPCPQTNSGAQISTATACASQYVPPQAAAVGYTAQTLASQLVASEFNFGTCSSASTWAPLNFNSQTPSPSTSISFSPGYATLGIDANRSEYSSACQAPGGGTNWHGTTYGGGGYFELTGAWNINQLQAVSAGSWPAWWAVDIECNKGTSPIDANCQWQGQTAGYTLPFEADFFEYDTQLLSNPVLSAAVAYTLHSVWGIFGSTCSPAYCVASTGITVRPNYEPIGQIDYNQFHRYGFLWVPATSTADKVGGPITYSSGGTASGSGYCLATASGGGGTGAAGYVFNNAGTLSGALTMLTLGSGYTSVPTSWSLSTVNGVPCSGTITTTGGWLVSGYGSLYIDDVLQATIGWSQFLNNGSLSPPPGTNGAGPTQSWAFGVIDIKHLLLIIETGANTPFQVKSVNVWQTNSAGNITQ